ncbi:unnamed protein product [Trifolium pratense]|uniref:Uncharacterized protein n=1 Tax=Trifolium pratense TaxID=57577 RepID=A0ACB0JAS4_TRIPR|nr:unnamed protein product [Trifolium pratense]
MKNRVREVDNREMWLRIGAFTVSKTFAGNLAMKIDISKAFDTLDWSFLLKVLKQFGFNTVFYNWIEFILSSAHMSISINGAKKGKFSSLQALQTLFTSYASCSGQVINASKSTIFAGGISQLRLNNIVDLIGFKTKLKLSCQHAWKASLLSMAGRAQLVKLVIQSMMVYSISVYTWPVSLLKTIETWSRNFIWSGDINKRKLVTVAWKNVYVPYSEGGLGLRSLISLNEATNLKLCWDFLHSEECWAQILRNCALRNGKVIGHQISSSLFSSLKSEFSCLMENWLVGNGQDINLWEDSWCGEPLKNTLQITNNDLTWLPIKVSDIMLNQSWKIPLILCFLP